MTFKTIACASLLLVFIVNPTNQAHFDAGYHAIHNIITPASPFVEVCVASAAKDADIIRFLLFDNWSTTSPPITASSESSQAKESFDFTKDGKGGFNRFSFCSFSTRDIHKSKNMRPFKVKAGKREEKDTRYAVSGAFDRCDISYDITGVPLGKSKTDNKSKKEFLLDNFLHPLLSSLLHVRKCKVTEGSDGTPTIIELDPILVKASTDKITVVPEGNTGLVKATERNSEQVDGNVEVENQQDLEEGDGKDKEEGEVEGQQEQEQNEEPLVDEGQDLEVNNERLLI